MGLFDPVVTDEQSFRLLQRMTEKTRQEPDSALAPPKQGHDYAGTTLVQIWSTSGSPTVGDILQANSDGLHPGRIRTLKGTTWNSGLNVWVKFIDYESDNGAIYSEHGRYYIGSLSGSFYSSSTSKPLFLCMAGEQTFIGKADSGISKGSSGDISLYHRSSEADSTFNQTAKALGAALTASKWCTVTRAVGGQWYSAPWEC
jgi:hypothetical protein